MKNLEAAPSLGPRFIKGLTMETLALLPACCRRNMRPYGRFVLTVLPCLLFFGVPGYSHAGEAVKRTCVADDMQRRVCVDGAPERVVSFAPNLTEMVFALDAGDRLVGRTERCNVPRQALKVPEIGAYLNPDIERVLAA
ncbi:MAG: hypothetical protein V1792_03455, partial [Pseudomonadota bacterium]